MGGPNEESTVEDFVTNSLGGAGGAAAGGAGGGIGKPYAPTAPYPPSAGFANSNPTVVAVDEGHARVNGVLMSLEDIARKYGTDQSTMQAVQQAVTNMSTSEARQFETQNQVTRGTVTQNGLTNRDVVQNSQSQTTQLSVTNRATSGSETGTSNVTGSQRRYIDVPTPEQFLDDFRNGMATYAKGLQTQGNIGSTEAMWMMDNMDLFLNDYLGKLGEMAKSGQQVFKPTAVTNQATKLGTRPGDVSSTKTTGNSSTNTNTSQTGTSQESGTRTSQGADNTSSDSTTNRQTTDDIFLDRLRQEKSSLQSSFTSSGTGPNGTKSQEDLQSDALKQQQIQNLDSQIRNLETQLTRTNQTGNFTDTTTQNQSTNQSTNMKQNLTRNTNMTEDVFSRPAIGTVHTLSPMDFLGQAFDAGSIRILMEGRKGQRFAMGRVTAPVQAKRI